MPDFTHLHVHSHYSLLDGLGKIEPLLQRAKDLNMSSLALTDHGVMYGVIEFFRTAGKVGIKPIIGVEAYLAPEGNQQKRGKIDSHPRHLTLLARNNIGYKNLVALTTAAHLQGYYYKPRIDYDLLTKHHEGLIILSGCLNSDISKAIVEERSADAERLIEWHLELMGREHFYLEVQHHASIPEQGQLNQALLQYAKKYNLHVVATNDTHYINAEDAQAQDVLLCVQTGKQVSDTNRMNMTSDDYSLKSPQQMADEWADNPEVLENSMKIAELCDVQFEFGVNKLPPFPLPKGKTADEALKDLCQKGLPKRYGDQVPAEALPRLEYELDVIRKTGYSSYFLIVADFVTEAKSRGILVGPGRGSAAGSLVSYLTHITNLDPLKYNLLFERFLNPERVSMPDIDLDFADDRRAEVIEYVRNKYGAEHVAQIITFGTMAGRAAVRDAGRVLGLAYSFCDIVAKSIPLMTTLDEALASGTELKKLYDSDGEAKRLIDTARKLEGVCRHASTHAAAVVITDKPLTEYLPVQYASTGEGEHETITQYAMREVEALGLLKIDFLGLKNLTIIKNTLDRIKERLNATVDIDTLPLDNLPAYRLLQEGKTTGVFQLESAGMKRYLKELKPTEFEDIISMGALYRPGPMDSIPDFIAAKHGRKKITYLHPLLEPILKSTYGVIVTQEQIMEIAREFAGFTYAEADILRKAVGKKIKQLLDEQREKFINSAVTNKGIDKQTAEAVWSFIEPFARYGFPRAHAAAYAMISYQTAYLKANYPADFMAALLTSDEGNMDRAAIEVSEAISMGIKILPPSINESYESFTVVRTPDGDAIRFGLGAIKNVGHNAVSAVITERNKNGDYTDLVNLFSRVDPKDINRKSLESLARAGAFDGLAERQSIIANADKLLTFSRTLHKALDAGQQGLFGTTVKVAPPRLALDPVEPLAKEEKLKWEKELLGMYVSEHPLFEHQAALTKVATPIVTLPQLTAQQMVRVGGIISKINKIITKAGSPMLFVELEDLTGSCEALVFPTILEKTQTFWQEGAMIIIQGKISDKDGQSKILTDKVWNLTNETLQSLGTPPRTNRKAGTNTPSRSLAIQLPAQFQRQALEQLKILLAEAHTATGVPVELVIPHNGAYAKLNTQYRVVSSPALLTTIRELVGQSSIIAN